MKSKKSIKIIKRQLIDIFGFSKQNLISFIENVRDGKCPSWNAERALKLVKGCTLIPKKGIKTTTKRTVYTRIYKGKKKETMHPFPPQKITIKYLKKNSKPYKPQPIKLHKGIIDAAMDE